MKNKSESHTSSNTTHIFEEAGDYPVTLRVTDNDNFIGMKTKTVSIENLSPDAPSIDGPLSGEPGTEYNYKFNSVDPDGDDVRYIINWGDTTSDTTDFATSGMDVIVSHTWTKSGIFTIKAKAEDEFGQIGPEATKTVTMPRDKMVNRPLLQFLQSHPNLFPILQKLIQQLGFGL